MQKEFDAIKNFLDKHHVEYKVYEHGPVYTSEQAAAVRGFDLKSGVKSLVFKVENKDKQGGGSANSERHDVSSSDSEFILALVSGDRKIDSKKLRNVLSADSVSLATPEEVLRAINCEIGSVHPFGNLAGLKTYMDRRILENKIIAFNAGLHTISMTMKSEDFVKLIRPEIAGIAKE